MSKVIYVFLSIIGCLFFNDSIAQSGQVVRIKSSNCAYNTKGSTTNFATGFVYKENGKVVGIITALHAVCGCSSISAEDNSGTDYFSLKITKADIGNDIALLSSSEVVSKFSTGLEFSNLSPSSLGNRNISMVARPYQVELNLDTKIARVRETPTTSLMKFVKSDVEISLKQRGSPSINREVLNLELEITPGCSGAPILYDNKVIGVANGGLDAGRTHVCWAIPTNKIQLSSISNLEPDYSILSRNNPNELFVLTCNLDPCQKEPTVLSEKYSGEKIDFYQEFAPRLNNLDNNNHYFTGAISFWVDIVGAKWFWQGRDKNINLQDATEFSQQNGSGLCGGVARQHARQGGVYEVIGVDFAGHGQELC